MFGLNCETLWRSKGSLPSSSDLDTGEKCQEINFEEKLEEANSLIEKVRKALRDISKGIYKLPDQKKSVQQPELVCSFVGECQIQKQKDDELEEAVEKACEPEENVAKEEEQQQQGEIVDDNVELEKKEDTILDEDIIDIPEPLEKIVPTEISVAVLVQLENEKNYIPGTASTIRHEDNDDLTNAYLESLRRIQEKLQTISEMSECEPSSEQIMDENTIQSLMVDRATSPIASSRNTMADLKQKSLCQYKTVNSSTEPKSSERVFLLTQETQTSDNLLNIEKCKKKCRELRDKKSQSTGPMDLPTQETQTSDSLITKVTCKKVGSRCEECEENNLNVEEKRNDEAEETEINMNNQEECMVVDGECQDCRVCSSERVIDEKQPFVDEANKCDSNKMVCHKNEPSKQPSVEETNKIEPSKQPSIEEANKNEPTKEFLEKQPSVEEANTKEIVSFNIELDLKNLLVDKKDSKNSLEKLPVISTSNGGTKDAKKLSIQVMPPVSIRSGLTMQRTLNLCIKPTGSVTNDLTVKPNVGYEEIKLDIGEGEESEKCPQDCRNPDGGHCLAKAIKDVHMEVQNLTFGVEHVEKDISGIKKNMHRLIIPNAPSILSEASRFSNERFREKSNHASPTATAADSHPENLREDALYMFRSFQIVDNDVDSRIRKHAHIDVAQKSPEELLHQLEEKLENIDKKEETIGGTKKSCTKCGTKLKETKQQVHEEGGSSVTKIEKGLYTPVRSPWDIGFYKTTATQCSNTSLHQSRQEKRTSESSEDKTFTYLSLSNYPDVDSYKKPSAAITLESLDEDKLMTVVKASKVYQPIVSPMTSISPRSTTEITSPKSSLEESSLKKGSLSIQSSEDDKETPVQDFPQSEEISMTEILSILTESKEQEKDAMLHAPKQESSGEVRKVKRQSETGTSNGGLIPATDEGKRSTKPSREKVYSETSQIASKLSSKSLKNSSSESDSSSSSYSSENVHGSIDSPVGGDDTKFQQPTGVKRPHPDGEKKSPTASFQVKPLEQTKAEKIKAEKIDAVIQTSPGLSSEETSSEGSGVERDRIATIKYFIKGLTGTSQDELAKLTSTSSVPKTDLPSYSRTVLKTLQEQRASAKVGEAPINVKPSKEVVVTTTEYSEPQILTKPSENDDNLSERTKLHRLREFQKMASSMYSGDEASEKNEKDKVVMSVMEQRNDYGGGTFYTKRQIPFYRRVLGRIIDVKKPMQTSHSDPNPVEESISEGEIKCRSSPSIGEIHPFNHFNSDRKKLSKGAVKYLKKHHEEMLRKDLGDRSHRIARQRTQYNSWVTYYLQNKHQNFSMGDDSSSPLTSSKR